MGLTQRHVLCGATMLAAAASRSWAQAPAPPTGPHSLPPLPYAPDANEPHIDAQTMSLHHDRHHAAYVANLNTALKDQGTLAALPVPELLARLPETPEAIRTALRNSAGGHANHSMFWSIMGGKGGAPTGPVLAAVDRDLGGTDAMRAAFNRMGHPRGAARHEPGPGSRHGHHLGQPPGRCGVHPVRSGAGLEAMTGRRERRPTAARWPCWTH